MADIKKMTVTTIFIVPTLKIDKNKIFDNNFINGYIKDHRKEENYENAVYLLFRPKDLDNFRDFVDGEYERTSDIIEDYDYEDGFVVLVYTLNPEFKEDFELVRKGKYSKTSEEFQALFPKIKRIIKQGIPTEEVSLQHKVFTKSDDLKEYWYERIGRWDDTWEVWDGFDEEKETLNIDKIKELA